VKYNCRSVQHQKAPEHILNSQTFPPQASNGVARTRRPARETAMKLIVQIPVLNEADTIAEVIRDIPRQIAGIDSVEVLIVDDGCTDDTVAIAWANGADHIVRHAGRKGLARAYQTGNDAALRLGADIIVNTDGDHQYPGSEIPRLIAPILSGAAEVVIGDRQVGSVEHFSPLKKALQQVGSGVVRWASETDVPDTVSGFRALSREAALRLFVTTDFSYTVENLIQAGKKGLTVTTVPIMINTTVNRPSRLHNGNWNFIKRQAAIIARTYATYEPLKTFSYLATPFLLIGIALLCRAFYVFLARKFINNYPEDNFQSLTLGGVMLILGFVIFLFGIIADRIGSVRRVNDEQLYRLRAQIAADERWHRELNARLDQIEHKLEDRGGDETLEIEH
jgi:glycosyltransferase involved in cell wall biosynthesis